MMTKQGIANATAEAMRFLKAAEKIKYFYAHWADGEIISAGVEHAALKRASLDLTRALAAMRRGE